MKHRLLVAAGLVVAFIAGAALLLRFYYRPTLERVKSHQVRVAAAADLRFALQALALRFEEDHDIKIVASYGSSGTFYTQLLNGAPYDLFLSADLEYPRQLAARGHALDNTEFQYGVGKLVLWARDASKPDIQTGGLRALADGSVSQVSIANPAHAPYGRAAVAAMQSAGVYDAVRPKLVFGEHVEQALQFVRSGAANVGIVALSLALGETTSRGEKPGRYVEVPLDMYPPIAQGGVILRKTADAESAHTLRAFLIGNEGRAILKRFGFLLPEP